jgi:hypothetical protein
MLGIVSFTRLVNLFEKNKVDIALIISIYYENYFLR